MLDLSNNNPGHENWSLVERHHQRVYLKLSEGTHFFDHTYAQRRGEAHRAGLKVGAYHFARPSRNTPLQEAEYFCRLLPHPLLKGKDLRPCLDVEDPDCEAAKWIAAWCEEWIHYVTKHTGHVVVIYGSPGYLEPCGFTLKAHPLWLASYGRNDGKEYPFKVPPPWKHAAAHQYASDARVPGIVGRCDVSRVLHPGELDVAQSK